MKQNKLFKIWLLALILFAGSGVTWADDIIPIRTDVSGFTDWTDTSIAGTTYLQLLVAGANTISPAMNFDNYTGVTLNFKARTYNGTNTVENEITVSISTNNGSNWTVLGTRTPTTNSLTTMAQFDLSSYSGTQVKIKFSVAGTSNSIGVGIDDITISGTPTSSCTSLGTPSVTATPGNTEATLSWDAVANASSYTLIWNGGAPETVISPVTKTGLTNGTSYSYSVMAVGDGTTYCATNTPATGSVTPTAPLPPSAPTATAATSVTSSGFTANWNAVSGATGYKLDVYTKSGGGNASDLFISEYIDGSSGTNKAIEIFNGTGSPVDLSNYRLWLVNNGGSWPETSINLTGTLANNDVFVITNGTDFGNLKSVSDLTSGSLSFNGNDAVGLAKNISGTWTLIDAIGVDGADPGTGWNVAGVTNGTVDRVLTRKSTVISPNTNWSVSSGTTTENSEWIVQSGGTNTDAAGFGSHTFAGGGSNSYVSGYQDLTVSGTSQAVSGLASGTTYYYVVRAVNANETSANSNVITVYTGENYRSKTNGNWNDEATWEVSSDNNTWVNASDVPAIGAANISIGNGHLITVTENASADLVTIQPTGKLTVNDGITLTSTVTLQSDATGTATVMGAVTGTATVNQAVTAPRTYYMGLPVSVSPEITGITGISKFNIVTDTWSDIATQNTTFDTKGIGYLVQVADESTTNISFKGTLNSGSIEAPFSTANRRFNYYGNPYPSFLETNKVITAAGSNIDPSIWFYSKGSGSYAFTTYNSTTEETLPSTADGGVIPPMQGFWLRAKAGASATSFTFTDEMRLHKPTESNAIFKAPKAAASSKLNLTISNGTVADETLVLFNEAAQTGFDVYDSEKMMNSAPSLNIFTVVGDQKLAMNGMPAVMYDTEIPLGVNVPAGTYTISAIRFANFAEGEKVQLIDKATNTLTDISATDYTFAVSEALNNTTRFVLVFPSKVGTSVNSTEMNISNVYVSDGRIVVNVTKPVQGNLIEVYNSVGQRIASQAITASSNRIEKQLNSGVYIVKVNAESTKVIIK